MGTEINFMFPERVFLEALMLGGEKQRVKMLQV